RTLFDLGFQVGHCCRSFRQSLDMAYNDPHSQSALSESRFLAGDWRLFEEFKEMLWRNSRRYCNEYIKGKITERGKRHLRFGSTINITEPNIKESPGGLRDYHFGLWLGSLMVGHTLKLLHMKRSHIIDDELMERVDKALSFVWRLRTDLHFLTGKEQDTLVMPLQNEVSTRLGYVDRDGHLSEEEMMRDYFTHAKALRDFADVMQEKCKPKSFFERFLPQPKKPLSEGFYIKGYMLHMPHNLHFFEHNPQRILMAFVHAAVHQKVMSPDIILSIRDNLELLDEAFRQDRQNAGLLQRFFSLPCPIHNEVRLMRDTGVLERIFPEWKPISFLVRYDLAHKYTVDEHSLLCLQHLETIGDDKMSFARERGRIWAECKHRDVVRLAVLMHDIGKGSNEDHSTRGAFIVAEVGKRLRLPERQRNQLIFLVKYHLLMSHIAQHRDLSDPDVNADFSDAFENQVELDMMYLLTYVDIQSVSKDSMTEWKNNLLWQLYCSTREVFLSEDETDEQKQENIKSRKEALIDELADKFSRELVQNHLDYFPPSYMIHQSLNTIMQHLRGIAHFDGEIPVVTLSSHVDKSCRNLFIAFRDKVGLFNRICTAIMLENFSIIEANLNTRRDGMVVNNIVIRDEIENGEIDEMRERLLKDRIQTLLRKDGELPSIPPSAKKTVIGRSSFKTRVKALNDVSARFTVLEVYCVDQTGLLQRLSSAISSLNMNIDFARLVTQGNRVVDVFYITDCNGEKILDADTLEQLKQQVESVANAGLQDG
ncbi:[protein-PII] uridylyltransferase, partial [bacterium]|nr:[protein-PII] uridylyltransferase [bacterium]